MFRPPVRPQQSPGASRPAGRFCSPASSRCFSHSPHGRSPRGCSPYSPYSPYSPGSPGYSPRSNRGYWDGSPSGFRSGPRGFGGPMRRGGDGFCRPKSFSPTLKSSDGSVHRYFNPSMTEDPWKHLQPVTAAAAAVARGRST